MKAKRHATRTMRNLTLSPRSEAILGTVSHRTGIARGRIVDLALDLIEICDDCQGTGMQAGPLGPETERCSGCAGERVRPVK